LTTYFSQGSVATDLRGGDSFHSSFLHRSFVILTVKNYENSSTSNKVLPFGARGSDNYDSPCISRTKLQSNHHQQTNTQFLQPGCPSCRPTNSVRALKRKGKTIFVETKSVLIIIIIIIIMKCIMQYSHRCRDAMSAIT